MVIWQPLAQIADDYGLIEYYRYDCKISIYDHVLKMQSLKLSNTLV